jgi:hypothetical protein
LVSFCVVAIVVGGGGYGAVMGWWRDPLQALYTGIKLPLVILLTTLGNGLLNGMLAPLLGLNVTFRQSFTIVLMSFAVTAMVLGALSPVALFIVWNAPPLTAATKLLSPEYALLQLTLAVTAEMLVTSWPLANGRLLLPRMLSNAADAPYLGEAAILFNLTRLPAEGVSIKTGGSMPRFVLICLALQLGFGLVLPALVIQSLLRWRKDRASMVFYRPQTQFGIWIVLLAACTLCLLLGQTLIALLFLVCAQLFPRGRRKIAPLPDSGLKSTSRDY